MNEKSYTLASDEKATQVMIGTSDMLLWGDLVTKEQVHVSAFLNTLAEDFVPLREVKILFLASSEKTVPVDRPTIHLRLEEILLFFSMSDSTPLPEESEVRRYEPVEVIVGSFQVEGTLLKSPMAKLQNLLLVSKEMYTTIYEATIRHVGKPWLGTFSASMALVRRDRMNITLR
jgi:hypothetical protein